MAVFATYQVLNSVKLLFPQNMSKNWGLDHQTIKSNKYNVNHNAGWCIKTTNMIIHTQQMKMKWYTTRNLKYQTSNHPNRTSLTHSTMMRWLFFCMSYLRYLLRLFDLYNTNYKRYQLHLINHMYLHWKCTHFCTPWPIQCVVILSMPIYSII